VPEPPTRRLDWGGRPDPDVFERRDDPKGWDRASITFRTHPLHRFPRVTQADLILPSAGDWLRLAGDCLVFGACVGLIMFFPFWIADVMANGGLANWVWGTMAVVGVLSAVFLFVVASRNKRVYFEPF
jgi:hypothetical protein